MSKRIVGPKRRLPKGSGSVYQRASDGLWVAKTWMGVGSERQQLVAYAKLAADAKLKLDDKKAAFASGRPQTPAGLTVGALLKEWIDNLPPETRSGSRKLYEYQAKIADQELGRIPVKTLSTADVERMDSRLAVPSARHPRGLKPQTRAKVRVALGQALKIAEIDYQIPNVVRNARPITLPTPERTTLSEEQTAAVLKALDGWMYRLAVVAISTAGRESEVLGIRVRDIDWTADPPVWYIRHQLSRKPYGLVPVKSESGRRHFDLKPDAVAALQEEIAVQRNARAAGGKWAEPIPGGEDLIFVVTESGRATLGTPRSGQSLSHLFRAALVKAGLPDELTRLSWHSLRKVGLNRIDAPIEVISALAGHSSIAVTLKSYAVVSDKRKSAAVAATPELALTRRLTAPDPSGSPADPWLGAEAVAG